MSIQNTIIVWNKVAINIILILVQFSALLIIPPFGSEYYYEL